MSGCGPKSTIKSTIVNLNRQSQSPISIANQQSQSALANRKICNPQSAVRNRVALAFRLLIARPCPVTMAPAIPTASTLSMAQETLPVVAGDKDRSLQEVLTRLTASRAPLRPEAD